MNPSITAGLDTQQTQAVTHPSLRLLCLAGPGSGKTTVLTKRILRLAQDGQDPAKFVVITFTNAAANELKARLDGIQLGYCGTLHGFMYSLLSEHYQAAGFGSRPSIMDEEQAEAMLEQSMKACRYKGTMKDLEAAVAMGPLALAIEPVLSKPRAVATHFFGALRDGNLVSFDTILFYGLRLIDSRLEVIQKHFSHLFVDEYQDTSLIDSAIYNALPIPNKFAVGDVDQAIYSFRGGNVENILALNQEWATVWLERNYRSDQAICRAAQALIEHNQGRICKQTISVSQAEGSAQAYCFDAAGLELSWLAAKANERYIGGKSVAVLVRTNRLAEQVADYLAGSGLPVARQQAVRLPEDWRQAKLYLKFLDDPDNDMLAYWLIRSANGPQEADYARLQAASAGKSINSLFFQIYCAKDLEDAAKRIEAAFSHATCQAIRKAIELIQPASLSDLILGLHEAEHKAEEQGEGIVVSTMHSAKGREFDVVFLPAFEQGTIPHGHDNLEEERRLAFVAMTRARHELLVSWAKERYLEFRGNQPMEASQFIRESGITYAIPNLQSVRRATPGGC